MTTIVLWLQGFHVLFLALHDWVPLGKLNDVRAAKAENPGAKLLLASALSTLPFAIIFALSVRHAGGRLPHGLWIASLCAYLFLFVGEIRAWWWPYFFGAKQERIERYRKMFANTAAFVPERNGIRPNTLHVLLHAVTLLTVAVSMYGVFGGR